MLPLVSVIIPVYNVYPYLGECLDSVINQTYRNLEILIIDDGSTDGSEKICDLYQTKDTRVKVIHQNNMGLSAARNTGLDIMRGDIVAFLDSDDAYLPDMIRVMTYNMYKSKADMVVCGYYRCKTISHMKPSLFTEMYISKDIVAPSKKALQWYLIENKINSYAWNKIYKRKVFDNLRFPEGYVYEDIRTMPSIIECCDRVMLIRKPLVLYRERPDSITTTYSERNTLDWIKAKTEVEKFISDRTHGIFKEKQQQRYIEKTLIRTINRYVMIRYGSRQNSHKPKELLEFEINNRKKRMTSCSVLTKGVYWLYKNNPCLYFVVYKAYVFLRICKMILQNMFGS